LASIISMCNLQSTRAPEYWHDIYSFLRPVKVNLGLRTSGVYRIPCECGRVCIGQTGRSVDIRLKEHQRHNRLEHPDKSAIAQHSVGTGHRIQCHNTSIVDTKIRYMNRIVREAIDIELHPNNMNTEVGFVSTSHGSLSSTIKKHT
jgi:hypothetical protein